LTVTGGRDHALHVCLSLRGTKGVGRAIDAENNARSRRQESWRRNHEREKRRRKIGRCGIKSASKGRAQD